MVNKNKIPVSVVIPTLGREQIHSCIDEISNGSKYPSEILLVIPYENKKKLNNLKKKFKYLNIKMIISRKKNQVYQRILGFKKSKNKIIMQLDDDVRVKRNCIETLYKFISKKSKIAVAPKYEFYRKSKLSKIYLKPKVFYLKIYHWILNSSKGFSPGTISLSGFNYQDESKSFGYREHDWLSGGIIMHKKKNLILKNYYPFGFSSSVSEDIIHSLELRKNGVKLIKLYDAKVSADLSTGIVERKSFKKTICYFISKFRITFYIVAKYKMSVTRFLIEYVIFFFRVLVSFLRRK